MDANELLEFFVSTSGATGIVILLILIVRRPFARAFGAEAATLLWIAPVARLALPPLPAWGPFGAPVSGPLSATPSSATLDAAAGASADAAVALVSWVDRLPVNPAGGAIGGGDVFAEALVVLWIVGAAAVTAGLFLRQRGFHADAERSSQPASAATGHEAAATARLAGWNGPIRIRQRHDAEGPMTAGLLRPTVYLPCDFETRFTASERGFILAHEFTHLRRGDLATALVAAVLCAAHWPNPLFWAAWRAFRADQEFACDAAVLRRVGAKGRDDGAVADYAGAVVKAVREAAPRPPSLVLPFNHPLKERIMALGTSPTSPALRRLGPIGAASIVIGFVAATAAYAPAAAGPEVQIEEKTRESSSVSRSEFTADKGETILIGGPDGKEVRRLSVVNKNGNVTIRAYDARGRVVLKRDGKAGEPDVDIGPVLIRDTNGAMRTLDLSPPPPPAPPPPPPASASVDATGACGEGAGAEAFVWNSTHEDEDSGVAVITHEVICVKRAEAGDADSRANAIRQAIIRLEEQAAAAEERRRAVIENLEAEIDRLEAEETR